MSELIGLSGAERRILGFQDGGRIRIMDFRFGDGRRIIAALDAYRVLEAYLVKQEYASIEHIPWSAVCCDGIATIIPSSRFKANACYNEALEIKKAGIVVDLCDAYEALMYDPEGAAALRAAMAAR